MRRFRCSHCPGRIFVERIPGLMGSKARRTERLPASDPTQLAHEERAFIDAPCEAAPEVRITASSVRAVTDLLRQDDPAG